MDPVLVPGLPNDLAFECLARVPWLDRIRLRCVSKSWAAAACDHHMIAPVHKSTLRRVGPAYRGQAALELFDPHASCWVQLPPGGAFKEGECDLRHRQGAGWGVIQGAPFVLGGYCMRHKEFLSSFWVFTVAKGKASWEERARMSTSRTDFAWGVLGGLLYVIGGSHSFTPEQATSAEVYDPASDTWQPIPDLPFPTRRCRAFPLDGELFVQPEGIPGRVFVYSPTSGSWRVLGGVLRGMWTNLDKLNFAGIRGGRLYMRVWNCSKIFMVYYPKTNRWQAVNGLPEVPGMGGDQLWWNLLECTV